MTTKARTPRPILFPLPKQRLSEFLGVATRKEKKKGSLAALRQNATTERREVTVPVSPPMQAASEAKEENECAALERQCATWGVAVAWCFFRNRTSSASQALAARNALPRSARALERAAPFGGPWATF